jgi:hypothetical protein
VSTLGGIGENFVAGPPLPLGIPLGVAVVVIFEVWDSVLPYPLMSVGIMFCSCKRWVWDSE